MSDQCGFSRFCSCVRHTAHLRRISRPVLGCGAGFQPALSRISHQIVDADASGFEPQRGALTKPRPTAWVGRRRSDGALKGRATLDATDCSSPLQGSTFRVKGSISKPRPLAWALLVRPVGAEGSGHTAVLGFSREKFGLSRQDGGFTPESGYSLTLMIYRATEDGPGPQVRTATSARTGSAATWLPWK